MNRFLPLALSCLFVLPLAAQSRARFGVVVYDPPAGWSHASKGGAEIYTSPDQAAVLQLLPVQPLGPGLERLADARVREDQKHDQYREETKRSRGRHPKANGYWVTLLCSYADPERSGQFCYQWSAFVAAADRCLEVRLVANTSDAYNTCKTDAGKLVDGIEFTTTMVVEKGRPPLTRFMLDESLDFLEWLLETPLDEAQRATVETEVRGFWQNEDDKEMQGIADLLNVRKQLAALKPAERDVARQAVQAPAIAEWRKDQDSPSAKMILQIFDHAHQPIAKGEPPLTRQAVESFAEFLWFAAGQTAGVTGQLSAETKKKLTEATAANYAKMAAEQRQVIAGMPMVWAALRALWPDLSEAQRKPYVDGWKQSPQLVELGKQVKAATAAESQSKLLSLQAQMQAQNLQFQMMSNIMQMQHQTNMAIINNMGGGGWHYEYRWR